MRADPSEWLVVHASAPIRFRVLTELHSLTVEDPNVARLREEVMNWPQAKRELRYQRQDGSWGGRIHAGDPRKAERSTEKVLWSFYELSWDREVKEIRKAAKLLKSFLTQKKNLPLFEFGKQVKQDPLRERHARWFLRIVALGLLQRGGWGEEKKVLDAIADIVERVSAFVADPICRDPVEHVGVGLPQIRREALRDGYCFLPDLYTLRLFAHCPALLNTRRGRDALKKIFDYMMSPEYQSLGEEIGTIRTVRGPMPRGWGVHFRSIDEYVSSGTLDELLYLLEQFARLGLINRYPRLMEYLDWLLEQQGKDGRWDLPAKMFGGKPLFSAWLRLDKDWKSPTRRIADVTFRVMVILKYQWERQMQMLERGVDVYGL
ncbi:MAG: hypothetical protein D6718_05950 [Acidobacteria bacterium]|nr:MAG: hypothetical protein D6718_05950 [Acidobacteriota bacterium]